MRVYTLVHRNSQHNLSTTITGNGRESLGIPQFSDGLRIRLLASKSKEFTGFPRRKTHPMARFRKPMLYPLSYEGITGFSSACSSFQHNLSTTFQELLVTTLHHSSLFKHANGS
jgi:hypothetical protein